MGETTIRQRQELADRIRHQTPYGRQILLDVVTPDVSVGALHLVKSQNLEALFSEVN
jgi:hypothetical protein